MKRLIFISVSYLLLLCLSFVVYAEEETTSFEVEQIEVKTEGDEVSVSSLISSDVNINSAFGELQCIVDAQVYEGMLSVCNSKAMSSVYGSVNTEMFEYASNVLNPCMAFATAKGEAGGSTSEKGISMTVVLATNSRYYNREIDWVSVTSELSQVDELWYLTNCDTDNQTNTSYNSCYMPISYLQNGGSNGLGIGPYQITTSNWNNYTLEDRMSPTKGWLSSMKKTGSSWLKCGVKPISDVTVMALMSMSHQGGAIIDSPTGESIIQNINTEAVQDVIRKYAWEMYSSVLDKAKSGALVNADDIQPNMYLSKVYEDTGITFSQWSYPGFKTNTGNYVMAHTLQYMFYRYYFGLEVYE